MKFISLTAAALLSLSPLLSAQTPAAASQNPPQNASQNAAPSRAMTTTTTGGKRQAPRPAMQEAPGGGPGQVWVNTNSSVYHCPGDRYYGKTAHGRFMSEAAARSAGAKGPGGRSCSTGK